MKLKTIITVFLSMLMVLAFTSNCKKKKDIMAQSIEYKDGDQVLEGYLAYDKNAEGRQPGVLIIHEWWGLTEYVEKRAKMLADMGYVAFAMDMYGKGIRAKDHKRAGELSSKYMNDQQLMKQRINTSLEQMKKSPNLDPDRIAVIGYCFGGAVAIEIAKAGMPVKGIVSFHGMLNVPTPEHAANIDVPMLIHHGAEDNFIPKENVENFQQALEDAGVKFEFVSHPDAVHGFTRWSAGDDTSSGIAYNKAADEKSWQSMKEFLKKHL